MTALSSIQSQGPEVSVLIPVKNGCDHLDLALASLASQTFRDFEIVLIDNGSTDATPQIAQAWAAREPRLRVFLRPDMFLGGCLREAVRLARAPLIARLDADDLAAPARLSLQVEMMRRHPDLCLLGSAAHLIDARGRRVGTICNPLTHDALLEALRVRCPFLHSSVIMRAEAYHAAGGYRPGLNMSEDYDLWYRMAERGATANLPDLLTSYRVHARSVTSRQPVRMALTAICVTAAGQARSRSQDEPFLSGVPHLRRAVCQLGIERASARRMVQMRVVRHRLSRAWLMLPLPGRLKALARAAAHRLGPRRLYLALLGMLLAPRSRAPAQERG